MMTQEENLKRAKSELMGMLKLYMPVAQIAVLADNLRGEERYGIADSINRVAETIRTMPQTYGTDGQGDQAVAYLHYFGGPVDAYVTEKDAGPGMSWKETTQQLQAFGSISIGYEPELGYISIQDLIKNGIELDLYWDPKKLKEIEA